MTRAAASTDDGEIYPIRTVATLTGVNPVTLRAWERRYGLIVPRRTASGHRLYSERDVERIREVLRLVEQGVPISRVTAALRPRSESEPDTRADAGSWDDYLDEMVRAISRFDEAGVETAYSEALSLYPIDVVTRRLLTPLLRVLGDRWASGAGTVAEEHFFSAYLRNKLGARFHHRRPHRGAPRLIAAGLPGEAHEIGLLLFALSAHDRGYETILLGANMPLEELAEVARRSGAGGIVLSASMVPSWKQIAQSLKRLTGTAGCPVFAGGHGTVGGAAALARAGAVPVGEDITEGLAAISRHLAPTRSARR